MITRRFVLKSFLIVPVLISMLSCTKDETKTNKDQPNASFISGYWILYEGKTFAINNQNNTIITATLIPGVFSYEFLPDGTFKSHDLSGNGTPSETGKWTLEIKSKDVSGITSGTLALTSPALQALKGQFTIDDDGFQRWKISTVFDKLDLKSKSYEVYPNKENWAEYHFVKQ